MFCTNKQYRQLPRFDFLTMELETTEQDLHPNGYIDLHDLNIDRATRINQNRIEKQLEDVRFRYNIEVSLKDYLLDIARQFLTISTTGFLGLVAINTSAIELNWPLNLARIRYIFGTVIVISILVIWRLFISKSKYISKILILHHDLIKLNDTIYQHQDDCRKFSHDIRKELLDQSVKSDNTEK